MEPKLGSFNELNGTLGTIRKHMSLLGVFIVVEFLFLGPCGRKAAGPLKITLDLMSLKPFLYVMALKPFLVKNVII